MRLFLAISFAVPPRQLVPYLSFLFAAACARARDKLKMRALAGACLTIRSRAVTYTSGAGDRAKKCEGVCGSTFAEHEPEWKSETDR